MCSPTFELIVFRQEKYDLNHFGLWPGDDLIFDLSSMYRENRTA